MAGQTSKENGKKGGRPKSNNTLTAEVMRERIAIALEPHIEAIVNVLIKKAKKGDLRATKELLDRAFGRPTQMAEISSIQPFTMERMRESRKKYVTED